MKRIPWKMWIAVVVTIGLLLGFIWLKWPKPLDAHLDEAEETVEIGAFFFDEQGVLREFILREGEEGFQALLEGLRAVKVQHTGLLKREGGWVLLEGETQYHIYMTAVEHGLRRVVGTFSWDGEKTIFFAHASYRLGGTETLDSLIVPYLNAAAEADTQP